MRNFSEIERIVIKVGTNVLAPGGIPNYQRMDAIAADTAEIQKRELSPIIVSSGAIGFGARALALNSRPRKKENPESLLARLKSGKYRAPAVRRMHIPKGSGQTRPLGILTFEDKVLQRAVLMLIEPIFELDFHDFSYRFRAGKSGHKALKHLQDGIMKMKGNWIIDLGQLWKMFRGARVCMDAPAFLGQNASKMEKKPCFSPGFSSLKSPWRNCLEVPMSKRFFRRRIKGQRRVLT